MKLPNRWMLIAVVSVVGLVLFAAGVFAFGTGWFEKDIGRAEAGAKQAEIKESIERVIPGVLVAKLELRSFANSLSTEQRKAIRDDVILKAESEGLISISCSRRWIDQPLLPSQYSIERGGVVEEIVPHYAAYGYIIGAGSLPRSLNIVANEGAVASAHQRARQWFEEGIRRLTEHLYNRQSITRVMPGVFAGRLELRPLADPLSAEEKEALRNDVIALARAEGFLGTEPPGSERGTGRRGAKRPFAARVVNKLGPHHVAYGYVVDSDGKQWTLEIAVNNEKEGAGFHEAARDWLGSFEGKGTGSTAFTTRADKSSIVR
ncbi:hypothetical protein M1O12_00825 [Dehalococcoidia bacterium]|nr:hypothetical protein [Dehalococcoidia bacterium]